MECEEVIYVGTKNTDGESLSCIVLDNGTNLANWKNLNGISCFSQIKTTNHLITVDSAQTTLTWIHLSKVICNF